MLPPLLLSLKVLFFTVPLLILLGGGAGWVLARRDFFGKEASLTVSGQLAAENLACALGRVYTFGPTFRAENSNTPKHAAEFWMIEPEMAFADLSDNMDLGESCIKWLITNIPGRTQTLPLYIYNQVETLNFARAHGAALLLVGAGLASLYAVRMLEEGRKDHRASC